MGHSVHFYAEPRSGNYNLSGRTTTAIDIYIGNQSFKSKSGRGSLDVFRFNLYVNLPTYILLSLVDNSGYKRLRQRLPYKKTVVRKQPLPYSQFGELGNHLSA